MTSPALYVHEEIVHNERAASLILPIVFQLEKPSSILDVGCGLGTWLSVARKLGVEDYLGIDGTHLNKHQLTIPLSHFKEYDLQKSFNLNRKFDLVVCLEVAEHLPEACSDTLILNLINHGDMILFSAAIPNQGGQNHINEQWPEYWQKKFARHGFFFQDVIRPLIWDDSRIEWWYRQNIFLLQKAPALAPFNSLSIVHPELLELQRKNREAYYTSLTAGKQGLKLAFRVFVNSIFYKIQSLLTR